MLISYSNWACCALFFSDAAGSFPFNRQMIYETTNKQQNINNKYQVKTQ